MRLVDGALIGQLFDHHGLAEIYVHLSTGSLLFVTSMACYWIIRRVFRDIPQGWPLLRVGIAFGGLIGLGEVAEHFFVDQLHDYFHYLHMIAAPVSLLFYYYAVSELRALYFDNRSVRMLRPSYSTGLSVLAVSIPATLALASRQPWDIGIEAPFLWLTVVPTVVVAMLVLRESAYLYSERGKIPVINLSLFSTVLAAVPIMATMTALLAMTIWIGRLSDSVPQLSFFYAGSHIWIDIWEVILSSVMAGTALALVAVRDVQDIQERILASARLFAFGEVAAEVADQIRTPISLIKHYAELLVHEEDLPETLRADARTVGEGVARVEKLAGDLLGLVVTSEPRVQVTNLKQVIDEAVAVITPRLHHGGVRVTRKFEKPLPFVAVDRDEIRRAILSLLGNAADAMPSGGRIHLGAGSEDGVAYLSITDQGPGINPELRELIDQPFFSTKEGVGTGLGLPLAKALIEKAHGTFELVSEDGRGATAKITLPRVGQDFIDQHLQPTIRAHRGKPEEKTMI